MVKCSSRPKEKNIENTINPLLRIKLHNSELKSHFRKGLSNKNNKKMNETIIHVFKFKFMNTH